MLDIENLIDELCMIECRIKDKLIDIDNLETLKKETMQEYVKMLEYYDYLKARKKTVL